VFRSLSSHKVGIKTFCNNFFKPHINLEYFVFTFNGVAWAIGARADCNFAAPKSREMTDAPWTPLFSPTLLIATRVACLSPFLLSLRHCLFYASTWVWWVLQQIITVLTTILGSLYIILFITSKPSLM